MENNLRTLFVKQDLDLLGPRTSFKYEEGKELEILSQFKGKISLFELLIYFKADFLVTPTVVAASWLQDLTKRPGYVQSMRESNGTVVNIYDHDLSEYDLVITHDPFLNNIKELKAKYPKTLFAYILAEHSAFQMHTIGIHYDLFLDHTLNAGEEIVRLPQSHNFFFPRVPDTLSRLFNEERNRVFIDYRSVGHFASNGNKNVLLNYEGANEYLKKLPCKLPVVPLSQTSLMPFMHNQFNENDSVTYYKKLASSKYFVTIANRVGQAAFDAASAGALVIGTENSKLHRILCHPEVLMKGEFTVKDVLAKIEELESNPERYKMLLNHQKFSLSLHCVESPINTIKQACEIKTS